MPLDAIFGHFQLVDQGGFISHASDSQEITVFLFVHDLVFPYPFGRFLLSMKHSYCGEAAQAALLSAGCVLEATKMVCKGDLQSACCVVRPPGAEARNFLDDVFFASENQIDF